MHVSANGSRVNLTRNIANITMDLVGMERTLFVPRGGADVITVEDLTGTEMDCRRGRLHGRRRGGQPDLRAAPRARTRSRSTRPASPASARGRRVINGDTTGDFLTVAALGGDDTIDTGIVPLGPAWVSIDGGDGDDVTTYAGTAGDDLIAAVANGPVAHVSSPPGSEIDVATERLNVLGGSGADQLSGVGNLAPLTALTFDGGAGDDPVLGGNGADTLLGGSGNDFVDGQQGNDTALLGSGNDTFQWDPGDGNDTVEGQSGSDSFAFNGIAIGEILDVSANGERVRFTRNIANIVTDLDDVERIALRALGGADDVTIGDMTGTDLSVADVDLGAFTGGGDAGAGHGDRQRHRPAATT